jgi:predicted secreted acid phosphatase
MLVANTLTWMLAVMMTVFYQRSTSTMAYYSDNYQSLTAMTDSSIKTQREKPHLIIMLNEVYI